MFMGVTAARHWGTRGRHAGPLLRCAAFAGCSRLRAKGSTPGPDPGRPGSGSVRSSSARPAASMKHRPRGNRSAAGDVSDSYRGRVDVLTVFAAGEQEQLEGFFGAASVACHVDADGLGDMAAVE